MTEEKKIYSYDVNTIFKALKDVSNKSSFSVKTIEESIKRIILSSPPSLLSYGERIEVIVQQEGDDRALVYVRSEPKFFLNVTAKNTVKGNIQKIYQMLDDELGRLQK